MHVQLKGADAIQWLVNNVEGVGSVEAAQVILLVSPKTHDV